TESCRLRVLQPKRRPAILGSSIAALLAFGLSSSSLRADIVLAGSGPGSAGSPAFLQDLSTSGGANLGTFGAGFSGGVAVAVGDGELAVGSGTGPGGTAVGMVFSGSTLSLQHDPLQIPGSGAASVALGDGELVVGAGPGGMPVVNVFSDSTF